MLEKHCTGKYVTAFIVFVMILIFFHPPSPPREPPRTRFTPKRWNHSATTRPTASPVQFVRVPYFNVYETTDAFHGDLIGDYENSKGICMEQIQHEHCDMKDRVVFPLLSYTDHYAVDLKSKGLEHLKEAPLIHEGELVALTWEVFWNNKELLSSFLESFEEDLFVGFRVDQPLALNCEDWSGRFSHATTNHDTDVVCGTAKQKFLCVCLAYV